MASWARSRVRLATPPWWNWPEAPAAVVCDLSGVTGPREPCAVSLLASLGAHAQHWPGTPVGVLCPDHALRRALEHEVLSRHLQIAASQSLLWPLLSEGAASTTVRESLVLAPTALAARAARDLVSRACLDWGRSSQIQAATLVVSELVTNAMVHAGTDLEVSLTRCGPRLRIAVKDHSSRVLRASRTPAARGDRPWPGPGGRRQRVVGFLAHRRRRQGRLGGDPRTSPDCPGVVAVAVGRRAATGRKPCPPRRPGAPGWTPLSA